MARAPKYRHVGPAAAQNDADHRPAKDPSDSTVIRCRHCGHSIELNGPSLKVKDLAGRALPRQDVEQFAYQNVLGSMSQRELADEYVRSLSDVALVQWATDARGRFPA